MTAAYQKEHQLRQIDPSCAGAGRFRTGKLRHQHQPYRSSLEAPRGVFQQKLPGFLSFVGAASARYNQLMAEVTRDTTGMLAGLTPFLTDGEFVFCSIARERVRSEERRVGK